MNPPDQATLLASIQAVLEKSFGFKLSPRTLTYILKRLDEFSDGGQPQALLQKILTKTRLQEFRTILREVLGIKAFKDNNMRNIDAINAVNFALSYESQGSRVAQEGLKGVLKWRKGRLMR